MITRYQVKAGEGSSQVKAGKYFNLLTSFNPVRLVIRSGGKELLTTEAAAGMSFTFESGFDEIEFYSDVTQSLTYWASNTKLTYEGEESKTIGARYAKSFLAYPRGGDAQIIVPANNRRQKITIEAQENPIFVGGQGVNSLTGFELKQGERLDIELAGDLFGWWTDSVKTVLFQSVSYENSEVLTYVNTVGSAPLQFEGVWYNQMNRTSYDGVQHYFDIIIPPLVTEVIFSLSGYYGSQGAIDLSFAISTSEPDDYNSAVLHKSIVTGGGSEGIKYDSDTLVRFTQSEEARIRRVWVCGGNPSLRETKIAFFENDLAPVNAVKVMELLN